MMTKYFEFLTFNAKIRHIANSLWRTV